MWKRWNRHWDCTIQIPAIHTSIITWHTYASSCGLHHSVMTHVSSFAFAFPLRMLIGVRPYSVLRTKVTLLSLELFLLLLLCEALGGNLRILSWHHQPIMQPMGTFEGLSVKAYIIDIASGTLSSCWGPILTKPSLTHAWPPLNVFTA